jgi:hypothetical protein
MIGVMTEDFALYHDLVAFLKSAGVGFVALSPRRSIPAKVSVLLTSEKEAAGIRFPHVVAVSSLEGSVLQARSLQRGGPSRRDFVIGIDPGERIGFAVVAGSEVVLSGRAYRPEDIEEIVRVVAAVAGDVLVVKVGHGAPTKRNRIISLLRPLRLKVLVVDESLTTKRSRRGLDEDAAAHIAMLEGEPVEGPLSSEPTPGEVKDIQRKSRIASQGRVTIDRETARLVATGALSLEEAVARAGSRPRRKG